METEKKKAERLMPMCNPDLWFTGPWHDSCNAFDTAGNICRCECHDADETYEQRLEREA